jgi:hypothetical protein
MREKYFLRLFSVLFFLSIIFSSSVIAWTTGTQIEVKIDEDKRELYTFRLTANSPAIFITEEDSGLFQGDEKCSVGAKSGLILQSEGRLSDIQSSACTDGDPQKVAQVMFGTIMKDNCQGACTLSISGSIYKPRGDLYYSLASTWVLCDATEEGNVYQDGDRYVKCEGGNFNFVAGPDNDSQTQNPPGTLGDDPCQAWDNQMDCQNISKAGPDCGWCAKPYSGQPMVNSRGGTVGGFDGSAVPYFFPTDTRRDKEFGCFNIKWGDPFNCGGCGIRTDPDNLVNPIGANPESNAAIFDYSHFCVGNFNGDGTPFCNAASDTCSNTFSSSPWFEATKSTLNPYYMYSVTEQNGGHKSTATAGTGSTGVAYNLGEIDDGAAACLFAGGQLDPGGRGCCGGGKPRYSSKGLCAENLFCDGSIWRDANTEAGAVFKMPADFKIPYPVAAVDGIFTMCVDAVQYDGLKNIRLNGDDTQKGCVPGVSDGPSAPAEMDYLCPAGYGYAGDNHVGSEGGSNFICRNSHLVDAGTSMVEGKGKFFCVTNGVSNPYAQAYLFSDSQKQWPFSASTSGDASRCPGSLAGDLFHKAGNSFDIVSTIGCPGMVDVDVYNNYYPGVFGNANGFGSYTAGVCLPFKPAAQRSMAGYFNQLNYVPSNNTIMGSVNGHGYVCTNKPASGTTSGSNAMVAICCGGNTTSGSLCGSDIPGTRDPSMSQQFSTGQFINVSGTSNNYRLYCRSDGSWGLDLDKDMAACNQVASGGSVVNTGKYCCSEAGDDNGLFSGVRLSESYTDLDGRGACFQSTFQPNDNFLNKSAVSNVFVQNGVFHGCVGVLSSTPANISNSFFLPVAQFSAIKDWPNPGTGGQATNTGKDLVKKYNACSWVDFKNTKYICSATGVWEASPTNRSHASAVPTELMNYFKTIKSSSSMKGAECCLANQCWDPTKGTSGQCINEQLGATEFYNINNVTQYKCMNGQWGIVDAYSYTPDGCSKGFCPQAGQCLYNPLGSSAANGNTSSNPQCINSGQFMGDDLCTNGSWSSRSSLAAKALANLVGSSDDYVLSCADANKVFINPQTPGAINTVCVLDLKPGTSQNRRLIATSLNQEIESTNSSIGQDYLYALKQSFLSVYPGATLSSSCMTSTALGTPCIGGSASSSLGGQSLVQLYYDKDTKIIIFSDRSVTLSGTWYSNLCQSLPSWLSWMCPAPTTISASLRNQTFDRAYVAKVNGKEAFGLAREDVCSPVGGPRADIITFRYKGYTQADITTLVGHPTMYPALNFSVSTAGTAPNQETVVNARSLPSFNIDNLWAALSFVKADG